MKRFAIPAFAIFSLSSFAAAMLALYLAFSIGLPRPYWAMGTVYVISQPIVGATRSKAIYRIGGTLLGATAVLALVPNLVNAPVILSVALALWVSACIFISMLDRSPRSYLFLLAGFSAAIMGFPAVNAPDGIWDVVVARCEEIGLGIICATAVHSVVFPRPVSVVIVNRVQAWLESADRWAVDALAGDGDPRMVRERRDVAAAATEVQMLATHLPFDTSRLTEVSGLVAALRERMVLIIPTLSGIADRTVTLKRDPAGLPPRLAGLVADTTAWVRAGADRPSGETLLARLTPLKDLPPQPGWRDLLAASLAARVASYIGHRIEADELMSRLRDPGATAPAVQPASVRPLPIDVRTAAIAGAAAFCSIVLICLFWIETGWTYGAGAAVIVAVFASLFAGQDDVKPASIVLVLFATVTAPLAAFYSFVVLPSISGFPMLTLALAPVLLVFGAILANPQLGTLALSVIMGFNVVLALQPTYQAEFANFANATVAQLLGMASAIGLARWLRAVSVDAAAWRILRLNWRDLAAQALGSARPPQAVVSARLVDRIAALAPKLAAPALPDDLVAIEALRDLRAGLALLAVQDARDTAPPGVARRIDDLVRLVGRYFSGLATAGRSAEPTAPLRVAIDAGLAAWTDGAPDPAQTDGLLGLVALRRNLFPDSPNFQRPPLGDRP